VKIQIEKVDSRGAKRRRKNRSDPLYREKENKRRRELNAEKKERIHED